MIFKAYLKQVIVGETVACFFVVIFKKMYNQEFNKIAKQATLPQKPLEAGEYRPVLLRTGEPMTFPMNRDALAN